MMLLAALVLAAAAPARSAMVAVPAGSFAPLLEPAGAPRRRVDAFMLDRDAVTAGEFLAFVRTHPAWRRSAVTTAHRGGNGYLASWRADLDPGASLRRPVTGVSWHAARAYCTSQGKRLPTTVEWEYAAAASATRRDATRDPRFTQQLVTLYAARRLPLPPVDAGQVNAYGVRGLHGLAWEWVDDFHGTHGAGHRRAAEEHDLSCAGAAIGTADPSNYAAFLRHALRAGLASGSTLETLGFRCAR